MVFLLIPISYAVKNEFLMLVTMFIADPILFGLRARLIDTNCVFQTKFLISLKLLPWSNL